MKIIRCHLCWDGFYTKGHNTKYCLGCRKRAYSLLTVNSTRKRCEDDPEYHAYKLNYHREYIKKNRGKAAKWSREATKRRKLKVFKAYGGTKCVLCNNDDLDVLTIDHINCGGTKHREEIAGKRKYDGQAIYRWLVENDYPDGFRVLCRNCNWKEHLRLNFGE